MGDSEKLPGEYRLARRVDEELETIKSPYVIPVVSNFLIRILLAAVIASLMATGWLILAGSNPVRSGRFEDEVEHNRTARLVCQKFDADGQPRPDECAEVFKGVDR